MNQSNHETNKNIGQNALLTKTSIEEQWLTLPKWQQEAFESFANMIADAEHRFPCVPGRQGFVSNQLRFCFLSSPNRQETIHALAGALRSYGQCSRQTGEYASLITIFATDFATDFATEAEHTDHEAKIVSYETLFWSILRQLHALDGQTWPAEFAQDPDNPTWEFVFAGEPYFAFCATPAHKLRKSRHFPWFLIAFQPRFVFEQFNDGSPYGQKMKAIIRKRLESYDDAPVHPALKSYGQADNHEWKQYFLRDDDSAPSKCPFLHHHQRATDALPKS